MNRKEIQEQFVVEFAAGEPSSFAADDKSRVEKEFDTLFPHSFVEFAIRFGAIHTPSILDLLTGGELAAASEGASFDVQEFMSPSEILEITRMYHSAGMNDSIVAIAFDCMGNVFGFHKFVEPGRSDDAPVLIFDHDFCEFSEEAESFDSWLKSFLDLKRSTER